MFKFYNRAAVILAPCLVLLALFPAQLIYAQREVKDFDAPYCDPAIPPPPDEKAAKDAGPHCQGTNLADPDAGLVGKYGIPFLNFLGAIVGLIVTISIVIGGIQYAGSAGDPNIVAEARKRIRNAVLALAAFLFLYGFLQWLVPGGFI